MPASIHDNVSVKKEPDSGFTGVPFPPSANMNKSTNNDSTSTNGTQNGISHDNSQTQSEMPPFNIKKEINKNVESIDDTSNNKFGNSDYHVSTNDKLSDHDQTLNHESLNNTINNTATTSTSNMMESNIDLQSMKVEINKMGQSLPEQKNLKIPHRQINGYVGFANLPKQWHRKSIRRGFNFNLLCVGKSGLGKTTLINSLFNQNFDDVTVNSSSNNTSNNEIIDEENPSATNNNSHNNNDFDTDVKIVTKNTLLEESGIKLNLTVVDAIGFGDSINNENSWEPIIKEINDRFDQYLDCENRVNRIAQMEDNRIHACLYFIEPTGHSLKELDLKFCQLIHEKCNLIPVIAKSDIMLDDELALFKERITRQIMENKIDLFQPPTYKLDDSETIKNSEKLYESLPYAVVGSNSFVTDPNDSNKLIRGREYPWGIIEIENSKQSDFNLLRDLLIRQYMEELCEKTNKIHYENYRSQKLIKLGIKQDNSVFKEFDPLARQEEEKKLHEAKLAKLESEMKGVFQQKVSEKEKKLQKSETELFARHKEMKEKLTKQLKALEEKKHQLEMNLSSQVHSSPAPQKKKGFLR